MDIRHKNVTILMLTLPLSGLIIIASIFGLFVDGTYSAETANWTAQAIGQDAVDLFAVVPFLIITAVIAYRKNGTAQLLWFGGVLYVLYTFVIYCFDVHFNRLFIVYCFTLGLSFYSSLYFMLKISGQPFSAGAKIPVKTTGIYLLIIAVLFYLLWLSSVIPAIVSGKAQKEIIDLGLPTNPVHVLDLSVCLPGFIITSVLLLKRKKMGYLLAPAVLVFAGLMDITIGLLTAVMKMRGLSADLSISYIMISLAVFNTVLLIVFLKRIKPDTTGEV